MMNTPQPRSHGNTKFQKRNSTSGPLQLKRRTQEPTIGKKKNQPLDPFMFNNDINKQDIVLQRIRYRNKTNIERGRRETVYSEIIDSFVAVS